MSISILRENPRKNKTTETWECCENTRTKHWNATKTENGGCYEHLETGMLDNIFYKYYLVGGGLLVLSTPNHGGSPTKANLGQILDLPVV